MASLNTYLQQKVTALGREGLLCSLFMNRVDLLVWAWLCSPSADGVCQFHRESAGSEEGDAGGLAE